MSQARSSVGRMDETKTMPAGHRLGRQGEEAAARWYQQSGFEIVDRNWHCAEGELDVVASDGTTVVFCEVKTRSSDRFIDPALAVDHRKQARIRTAALRWLESHRRHPHIRFDVALVVAGQVRVIEQAF